MFHDLGDSLLSFCEKVEQEVVFIAPFIKHRTLSKLISAVPVSAGVTVYTRWRPEEVAMGVSDLEIFDLLASRPQASLRLTNSLHAKYYRFDSITVIGSANLTEMALGWARNSNLEILTQIEIPQSDWMEFEEFLFNHSLIPDAQFRNDVKSASDHLVEKWHPPVDLPELVTEPDPNYGEHTPNYTAGWLPATRHPELLFDAYAGHQDQLTSAAKEQTTFDLSFLDFPYGVDTDSFSRLVLLRLRQVPLVLIIEEELRQVGSLRFGATRDLVRDYIESNNIEQDPSSLTQILLRWMTYFGNKRYFLTPSPYSEVLSFQDTEV